MWIQEIQTHRDQPFLAAEFFEYYSNRTRERVLLNKGGEENTKIITKIHPSTQPLDKQKPSHSETEYRHERRTCLL